MCLYIKSKLLFVNFRRLLAHTSAGPRRATISHVEGTEVFARAANLRTKILDLEGFDSSRASILRGAILRSMGGWQARG